MNRRATLRKDTSGHPALQRVTDSSDATALGEEMLTSLRSGFANLISRPVYIQITTGYGGKLQIKQIGFLSVEDFALLVKVEPRTVLSWVQRGIAPTAYRPPGSRSFLFDLDEAIQWIKNNPVVFGGIESRTTKSFSGQE